MDALGVERVVIMPDPSHVGERVIKQIGASLTTTRVEMLTLPYVLGTGKDTQNSVRQMRQLACSSIVVMGGDGTSRIAATVSETAPLIPVSTGTNNVFPQMVEGTLVGLAAAALATGTVSKREVCTRAPRLEVCRNGELVDIALVDVAVVDSPDAAAKAVWEPETIREVFLTQASPSNIGLSAIGGYLPGVKPKDGQALHVALGGVPLQISAPIAPGLIRDFGIRSYCSFRPGEEIPINHQGGMIALDGERELPLRPGERMTVRLSREGPVVLRIADALELARARGFTCRSSSAEVACG